MKVVSEGKKIPCISEPIKETDKNAEIIYKSKEDALNDMKQHFADRQNLLEGYEENNIFPAYYEVNSNKKAIEEIEAKLSNNKKIKHIIYSYPFRKKIYYQSSHFYQCK